MKWSPDNISARNNGMRAAIDNIIAATTRGERARIQIERATSDRILGRPGCVAASRAQFREGCIKVVESGIWRFPQKARVLAEIHRRFDHVAESDYDSAAVWRATVASIYDFAGAWALAARLMQAGLCVAVLEEALASEPSDSLSQSRVDVELIIPIGPMK